MAPTPIPRGDEAREAIDALRGYVYQIYQSTLALIELEPNEILYLEVAEDYAIVAGQALKAVQVKETGHNVTINSDDIVASIDSFVDLCQKNPALQVRLRHLTTSKIGKERSTEHRIGDTPTLDAWRQLSKTGDLSPLRKILAASKLSKRTKNYINELNDTKFREEFLKRIHFDCGALDSRFLLRQLRSKLLTLLMERGGVNSQVDGCLSKLFMALLHKATQKKDRLIDRNTLETFLEEATHIPVNRAHYEAQNQLISKSLAASIPQNTNLVSTRLAKPKPINEVPFPAAISNRTVQIDNILSSLSQHGISWIYGAAGVGKSIGAKIAARRLGGIWASINIRGLNAEQVTAVLSDAIDSLTEQEIDGLIVDDLECQFEPYILDILLYLHAICNRADLLLLIISPKLPSTDFLFTANLPVTIKQKFEEFSELEIREILDGLGVQNKHWAKYIHVVSGGGHPQLAIAAIHSMQNSGWDISEFKTLNSLLYRDTEIEQVRARTRERLFNEMSEGGRRLIERLSLKSGSFRRSFVLDMAQIAPVVADGGIVFDRMVGSWVDQQEKDRFALSPLLANFALSTMTDEIKREVYFEIANSLIKIRSLDPIEANSALLAALSGKNTQVIVHLCMAVLGADQNDIRMIAPHLVVFRFMRTDVLAYDDPAVSQMFRGVQLILSCQEEHTSNKITELLDRFEEESERVESEFARSTMAFLVFSKLLLSEPKCGALPNFWNLICKIDGLLENQGKRVPSELSEILVEQEMDGIPIVGFMFVNQARQIELINGLIPVFEFLNSCGQELRQKLLKPYSHPDFDVDMLVASAWLKEHKANSIDPPIHSSVFAQLEEFAESWGHIDLAVCCRKYRAIIIDEYGSDKDHALKILDEGLELYGVTNSELVRAKAKVFYRADEHQGSLELSKVLIEGDAPLSKTEKAFLGRDAAISAEKQGDYETARRYFLYGSGAAGNCDVSDMIPMRVGLMADAALASWHAGDRETCLSDFVKVLQDLNDIDPKSSLRAAHCHAICRHVLLWLDQEATGEKRLIANGEETKIYPGVVSNPEPHPEIGERFVTPIEMAWYMLATVENNSCLDIGITQSLTSFLPKGPVFEGQFILTQSKMRKAFTLLNSQLFVTALRETVAEFSYAKGHGDYRDCFNIKNVTYGSLPVPSLEQQAGMSDLAEMFVLCFVSNCVFTGSVAELNPLIEALEKDHFFKLRKEFLKSMEGHGSSVDYNTSFAALLATHIRAIEREDTLAPSQIFELALKAIQVASKTYNIRVVAKYAFDWIKEKWNIISQQQRFLLKGIKIHEQIINQILVAEGDSWLNKVIDLLQAILPTMGFQNEHQLGQILNEIRRSKC